jgi:DNA-binding XRE family transcriptional regulator
METRESPGLGEMWQHYRGAAGLTQAELAERAGLSTRAVSDLERGVKSRPHKDTVRLLAAALALAGEERATFAAAPAPRLPALPGPRGVRCRWRRRCMWHWRGTPRRPRASRTPPVVVRMLPRRPGHAIDRRLSSSTYRETSACDPFSRNRP